jgi:hypothetical protein
MSAKLITEKDPNGLMVGRCSECPKPRFAADAETRQLYGRIGVEASIRVQFDQHRTQKHLYDPEIQKRIDDYRGKVGSVASAPMPDDAERDMY